MRQPYQVLVHAVRRTGGAWEYLLVRRIPALGGFWQGVTGGMEEGERLIETAARELREETGLVAQRIEAIGFSYVIPMQDRWRPLYAAGVEEIQEDVFVALVEDGAEPVLSHEHDALCWCRMEEGLAMLCWPENLEALSRCDAWLADHAGEYRAQNVSIPGAPFA